MHKGATFFQWTDQLQYNPIPAPGASQVNLMEFKRKAQGGKSSKHLLTKKRLINKLNAQRRNEKQKNAETMTALRKKKNADSKQEQVAYMWQNLRWWIVPDLDFAHKRARGVQLPRRLPEGLNFMHERWST